MTMPFHRFRPWDVIMVREMRRDVFLALGLLIDLGGSWCSVL